MLLELDKVRLPRGSAVVLDDVSLRIAPGRATFVLGPNGSGKSTLLLGALGLLPTRVGRVTRAPELQGAARLGFVPQRVTLDDSLPTTVGEFVGLGLAGLRVDRHERGRRIEQAIETVGLGGHRQRSFWAHSEGERQRLLLARALARRPLLLCMDEPTASLDPAASHEFWLLVDRLRREHDLTLCCATHDLLAARWVATDVALCVPATRPGAAGRVLTGTLQEARTWPETDAVFGPTAALLRGDRPPGASPR